MTGGAQQRDVFAMRETLAVLGAAATGVQVGAAIIATRFVTAEIGPFALAFLRYAIGVACLIPVLVRLPRVRFARADILPIGLLGIGQFGVLIALLNHGLKTVPAGRGALLFATVPMLTLLIAVALGRERFTAAKIIGILTTLAGVALALGDTLRGGAAPSLGGDGAILAAAFTGAACSVLYRPYLMRYPTLPVSAFAMLAAAVALAVPALFDDLAGATARLTPGGWGAIVFIGLSSGTFYVIWLWALKTIAATRVTVFLALSPITASLFGAALLGEPLTAGMIAGCACVAAGLWATNRE